ncbi:MAG: helix-turn-helix domain-containing protein [Lachnospiraceae bacterium]
MKIWNVEFKQEYVPDIRKEVMGFANAEGGSIFVGVRKDGRVLALQIRMKSCCKL